MPKPIDGLNFTFDHQFFFMFNSLFETYSSIVNALSAEEKAALIEDVVVCAFGDKEKAIVIVEELKEKNASDGELGKALIEKLHLQILEEAVSPLKDVTSIFDLIKTVAKVREENIPLCNNREEVDFFIHFYLRFKEMLLKGSDNGEDLFHLKKVIQLQKYSIKKLRDEIGVNKRTFSKWLQLEFGDRFVNKRSLSFDDYFDVHQMLLLRVEEDTFNFRQSLSDYLRRLQEGVVFKKSRIVEIAHSNYKEAAEYGQRVLPNYKTLDVFPYRVAYRILDELG